MKPAMNCPACKTTQLVVIEREGVEIDYCPNCRGVWLERNELETIIKRANEDRAPSQAPAQPNYPPQQNTPPYMGDDRRYDDRRYDDRRRYDDDDYKKHHGGYYKKKKGGFLEDLFDF